MLYRLSDWMLHRRQLSTERIIESNVYAVRKMLEEAPGVGTAFHWIHTHLIIPSPLATTHSRYLLGCTFSTRVEALIVMGFWMISIVLSLVGYKAFSGNI